ncbi:MAG: helix-hairpin-helix domain-containing protein [Myxococcales bacterium]|nr:helix-hairpin-helix domain-containing protein [Myxococcales bacterium]
MTNDNDTPDNDQTPEQSHSSRKPNRAERRRLAQLAGTLGQKPTGEPMPAPYDAERRGGPNEAAPGANPPTHRGIDPWARARDKIIGGKRPTDYNSEKSKPTYGERRGTLTDQGARTDYSASIDRKSGPLGPDEKNRGFTRKQPGREPRLRPDPRPVHHDFSKKTTDGLPGNLSGRRFPAADSQRWLGEKKPQNSGDWTPRPTDFERQKPDRRGFGTNLEGDNRAATKRPDFSFADRRPKFHGENERSTKPGRNEERRYSGATEGRPYKDRFSDERPRRPSRPGGFVQNDNRGSTERTSQPRKPYSGHNEPVSRRFGNEPSDFTRKNELETRFERRDPPRPQRELDRSERRGGERWDTPHRRPDAGDRPFTKRTSPGFKLPTSNAAAPGSTGFVRRGSEATSQIPRLRDYGVSADDVQQRLETRPPRSGGPGFKRGFGAGRQRGGGTKRTPSRGRWDDSSDGDGRIDGAGRLFLTDRSGHATDRGSETTGQLNEKRFRHDSPEPGRRRTTNRWDQRGKLSIAVRTTHRLSVADPVKSTQSPGDTDEEAKESSRLLRVPASKRSRIHVNQQQLIEPEPIETTIRRPRALPVQMEGRSATAEDDELSRLIREEPMFESLRVPKELFVETIGKLPEVEQERWLGLRNGMTRVLRPRMLFDTERVKETLETFRASGDGENKDPGVSAITMRAAVRAEQLLNQDPLALWNLSAAAMLPIFLQESGADERSWVGDLPDGDPLPIPWPIVAAVPLVAETGRWRVEKLLGLEGAEERFADRTKKATARMFPLPLRTAIVALSHSMGRIVADPRDDDAWSLSALRLVRHLATLGDERVRALVNRPCEPSGYVTVGKRLLKQGTVYLAQQCLLVATILQPDHQAAQATLTEATDSARRTASTLTLFETNDGVGQIIAMPDPETPFVAKWKPFAAGRLNLSGLHKLALPPAVEGALVQAGYVTVAQVKSADAAELIRIAGIGPREMLWIREALRTKVTQD